MNARVEAVRALLEEHELDALLIKGKTLKRYLGTVTGSGCKVLITREGGYLIMDGRYVNEAQALEHSLTFCVHDQGVSYLVELTRLVEELCIRRMGVEASAVLVPEYARLIDLGIEPILLDSELARMRMIKEESEIAAVQRAVDVADEVYAQVIERLHVGMSEYEISALVQYYSIAAGAEAMSFDTIVATGERSALPHGRPTARTVREGEPILIDFGVQIDGYQSDMTRVCFLGEPSSELVGIYDTVLAAHLAGIAAIRAGVAARDVDAAARHVIVEAGYGEYFTHGLGHGIGMGGDLPLLNASSETTLEDGMIMSCEPGVYLPGVGGVRIEDDVLLRDGRACPLNHTPKKLRVLEVR